MFGEDVQVDKFFHNKSNGFYVDVGCYHPLEGNNTYLLHKRNWRGINIDANSLSIDLFNIVEKSKKRYLQHRFKDLPLKEYK